MLKVRIAHPAIGELAFPLEDETFIVIGREDDDVGIEFNWDPRISRRHARIWVTGDDVWFEDLGSSNGSWIDGRRIIEATQLAPGTPVTLGDTVLTVGSASEPRRVPRRTLEMHAPIAVKVQELEVVQSERRRAEPRFLTPTLVEIGFEDKADFKELWASDISKGGLFIDSPDPLSFGTALEVRLVTPGGRIRLMALVVHVARGDRSGMGVQFERMDASTREAISRYVDGIAQDLSDLERQESTDIQTIDLDCARQLLVDVGAGELYRALDLPAESTIEQITARIAELRQIFSKRNKQIPPPQLARLEAAQAALQRIESALTNADRRLSYDFRSGHIDAERRIADATAGRGPNLDRLRQAWLAAAPVPVQQAAILMQQATSHRELGDRIGSLRMAKRALDLSPFDPHLRELVANWTKI